ncbi:putative epoxide hydrolase, partial [Ramaria rubella]
GSFLEFLPIIPYLVASTSPAFHVIVPSLPGYTFSSPPSVDKDFSRYDVARLINKLMVGLGFGNGYAAQGGDIGSDVARILGARYDTVKIVHLNFCGGKGPDIEFTEAEKPGVKRMGWFLNEDYAYVLEHRHRSSTISIVLASNPVALLAWVGEKFLSWSDVSPSLDTILESVTLWWVTETFPRSIYPYRKLDSSHGGPIHMDPNLHLNVPLGFSNFAKEIIPMPERWVASTGNLVLYRHHEHGGHFAALEVPEVLAKDIADFVKLAWR